MWFLAAAACAAADVGGAAADIATADAADIAAADAADIPATGRDENNSGRDENNSDIWNWNNCFYLN